MKAVYSSQTTPTTNPIYRGRLPLVMFIVLFALLMTACGNSGSSSNSNNNNGNSELSSEALVAAYAYQMVLATALGLAVDGNSDGTIESRHGQVTPESRQSPTEDTTIECNTGSEQFITNADSSKVIYNDCHRMIRGVQYEWDGAFTVTELDPVDGFDTTELLEFDNLKFRQSTGSRHYEMIMEGTQRLSYSPGVAMAGQTNMAHAIDYLCTDGQETFDYTNEGDFRIDRNAEGFRYEADGDGSIRGHTSLNGNFAYETTEPLEFSGNGDGRPYMGTLRINPFEGDPVMLRFEQSGVYINEEFHTWEVFINLSGATFASPVIC